LTAPTVPILRPEAVPPVRRRRLARGERRALIGLLLGTAVLYLWDLGSVGWANSYRAGAVQAMTQNGTAFLFGSSDAGNIVTIGEPPGSLWIMAVSGRVFGFSSWSMLVPQALMGVASVALLYAAVRRVAGPGAGLLAGAVLALTPAAITMFRYNDPDALLVLLLVAAAYAVVRAIEAARTRWLVVAGTLAGFAFLTKTGQAFVPLPGLALAYLFAAPTGFGRRVGQLLAAGVALVVAGGWWYAVLELTPAGSRPYIGGSPTDSARDLVLGHSGLGRILGGGGGGAVGGAPVVDAGSEPTGPGVGSGPGLLRMIDAQNGVLVGWLLPAALALLLVGLLITSRAPRTDATRASLLLWGGWTVATALVLSLAEGSYRPHDTVALAPGIAALVGIGSALLWERRRRWAGRGTLALLVAGTVALAWLLLDRTPEVLPRWAVVAVVGVVIAIVLVALAARRRAAVAVGATLALMALAGPAAYAAQVTAAGGQGGIPGTPQRLSEPGPAAPGTELVDMLRSTGRMWSAATVGAERGAALALASDTTVMGIGGLSGGDPAPTLEQFQAFVAAGQVRWFVDGGTGRPEIATWVQENFAATTVGDRTVYDLDRPRS
jgi:4-amino-4-deoxy-L-arabinose transferase-like glycosyltransferase